VKHTLTGKAIAACYFLSKSLYLLRRAINEDLALTNHPQDAVNSPRIAFTRDESICTGKVVRL